MALELIINSDMPQGLIGEAADQGPKTDITYINDAPRAKQVSTITVDSAVDATEYTVTIDGIDITINSGTSSTTSTIATALGAAIQAEGLVNGRFEVSVASNVVTLTARVGGQGFTLSAGAGMTAATTTANALAASVPFGRAVMEAGFSTYGQKLAKALSFTAQVDTLTLTYDASVGAKVSITYYDPATGQMVTSDFEHTQATDADTSVAALVTEINAVLPANTVIASSATNVLTLTSELPGAEFSVSAGFGTGRDTGVWAHTTNKSAATSFNLAFAGVTRRDLGAEVEQGEVEAVYKGGSAMSVRQNGRLNVGIESTLAAGQPVYVRLAANGSLDKIGNFASAPGAGLLRVDKCQWVRPLQSGVAVLEIQAR